MTLNGPKCILGVFFLVWKSVNFTCSNFVQNWKAKQNVTQTSPFFISLQHYYHFYLRFTPFSHQSQIILCFVNLNLQTNVPGPPPTKWQVLLNALMTPNLGLLQFLPHQECQHSQTETHDTPFFTLTYGRLSFSDYFQTTPLTKVFPNHPGC